METISTSRKERKRLEAFNDTLGGWGSDRSGGRLGRRIPCVLSGTPLMALFGFLLFVPPAHSGGVVTALYLFLILELFYLSATFASAPYDALLPEIASTDAERVDLSARRVYFGVVGAAVGMVGSGLLVARFGFCLLYTSDAADERSSVDLGGRRIIKKKTRRITE